MMNGDIKDILTNICLTLRQYNNVFLKIRGEDPLVIHIHASLLKLDRLLEEINTLQNEKGSSPRPR